MCKQTAWNNVTRIEQQFENVHQKYPGQLFAKEVVRKDNLQNLAQMIQNKYFPEAV